MSEPTFCYYCGDALPPDMNPWYCAETCGLDEFICEDCWKEETEICDIDDDEEYFA